MDEIHWDIRFASKEAEHIAVRIGLHTLAASVQYKAFLHIAPRGSTSLDEFMLYELRKILKQDDHYGYSKFLKERII